MHCHHEKLVIVDGEVAFVGGIDLTSWAAIVLTAAITGCMVVSGGTMPAAGCVAKPWQTYGPFRRPLVEVTGEQVEDPAPPAAAGEVELQVVRTVPEKTDRLPSPG